MGNLRKIRKNSQGGPPQGGGQGMPAPPQGGQGMPEGDQGMPMPAPPPQGGQGAMGNAAGLMGGGPSGAGGEQEIDKETQMQMEDYTTTLMHIIHSPDTSQSIMEMLSGGPAIESIPFTANKVNAMVEKSIANSKGSQPIKDEVKLAGAIYLVSDLAELGNAAGVFEQDVGEQDIQPLLQATMQEYIQVGLRDGTIDPIQLQKDTEPLLNEEQAVVGNAISAELGQPQAPTAKMGMDKVVANKTKPLQDENAMLKREANEAQKAQAQGGQA